MPSPSHLQPTPQVPVTSIRLTQAQNNSDLAVVSALADGIRANCLPTPEPTVITGDPLKFNGW